MFSPLSIQHHRVRPVLQHCSIRTSSPFTLVLYFHRIKLWGNFLITIAVGALVGIGVMLIVKPRLKASIEGENAAQQRAGLYLQRSH